MNQPASKVPVLIAGGGATGSMLALLLAQQGIRSLVVEARAEPYGAPRAHALNPRSLEICRSLGLDMDRLHALAAPRDEAGRVRFVTRLFGLEFGSLPYERQDDDTLSYTPTPLINVPQPEFEALLADEISRSPLIEYRRGTAWCAFDDFPTMVSRLSADQGEFTVASQYVVGCDGAGSTVRAALGIDMAGDPAVVSCVSIVFRADLRKPLAGREGILFWVNDPATPGTFLGYHMGRLWTFVTMQPPGHIDMSQYAPDRCREMVMTAAGGDIPDFELLGVAPWTMTSQIADRYQEGRAFLAGDAAHRFPPTGGLGLNTGIQDAHNLAWKLAAVLRGEGGEELLSTYGAERRPVAQRNADQSYVNAKRLAALEALRCPEEVWRDAAEFSRWMNEGARRQDVAAAIALQAEHFDSFGLQLGYVYGRPEEPRDVTRYDPKAEVGARMPHAWLDRQPGHSTLDLLDPAGFTLFGPEPPDGAPDGVRYVALNDPRLPRAWLDLAALDAGEGLLVRPDGHIAFRGPVRDAARQLSQAMRKSSNHPPDGDVAVKWNMS